MGIWRVIQNYFATARVIGSHLKIQPLAAIFAVLVGAEIGGIVGICLAGGDDGVDLPDLAFGCLANRLVH